MEIYFIRHGETDWNKEGKIQGVSNRQLNNTGKEQAVETARKLNTKKPTKLMSSPLDRAQETMQIIKEKNNWENEVIIASEFLERDFGELEGVKGVDFLDLKKAGKVTKENYPAYETDQEIEKRVQSGIKKIIAEAKNDDELVLVTAHAHTLKAVLVSNFPEQFDYTYYLPNCAIVKLEVKDGKVKFNGIDA